MTHVKNLAQKIEIIDYPYKFSICTLVTRMDQYEGMLRSFIDAGFSQERCEYLYIDNSQDNKYNAYSAFNIFLQRAQGKYIIICHQDIELLYDRIEDLEQRIYELDKTDPKWALLGNAGGINLKYTALKITHGTPSVFRQAGKSFPQKVMTLDENFILIKKYANLAVSSDLAGFHFYGADICLIARILGFNAYVIDFHIYHQSRGNKDKNFYSMKKAFRKKYQSALKGYFINTATKQKFYVSGSRFCNFVFNTPMARNVVRNYFRLRLFFKGRY